MAIFVISRDLVTIAVAMPGASFSKIGLVASGVTSRGANPVPPVVKMTSTSSESLQSMRTD